MGRKLLLLAVMSLLITGVASAAVENIKVSGDITVQTVIRDLTLGSSNDNEFLGFNAWPITDEERFLLSQTRLRFDADLTENVSATIRLINEHLWGEEASADWWGANNNSNNTDVVVDLSYIELKEFLYQPLTLKVGRQNLYFGNGLIIGDPDTNQGSSGGNLNVASQGMSGVAGRDVYGDISVRKSFDAIRGTIDYSPYVLDFIYAKVSEGYLGENSTDVADDVTLSGVNASYQWASYNGITEGYFYYADNNRYGDTWWLVTGSTPALGAGVGVPAENQAKTYTLGGRIQMDPTDKMTLGLEYAHQFGPVWLPHADAANPYHQRDAFAVQFLADYSFLNKYNAKLNLSYTYLSGADDLDDNQFEAWDPMFEDQTPAEIMNILFPHSNAHFATVEGSMMPREDITVGLKYAFAKLAQNVDGYVAGVVGAAGVPSTARVYSPTMGPAAGKIYVIDRDNTYLGSEIDAYAVYDYTEDVQIKILGGWFIPGDFFANDNDDLAYSVRTSLSLNF